MKNLKNYVFIFVFTFLAISLNAKDKSGKIYLTISHEVADFTSWKTGFEQHSKPRVEAGLKDVFVKQDINNPNAITAFFVVSDVKKAEAFLANPELKEAMEKSGVVSAPVINFYKSAVEFKAVNPEELVTTVSHSVKDFAAWNTVYSSAGELRGNAGVNDYLVLRSLSDENVITVIGTSSSAETFTTFMSNPGLKEAMEKAGVTSKPEVKILQ